MSRHPLKAAISTGHNPRAAAGRPPRHSDGLGAPGHSGSDAVDPSRLGRSPHWPVLTCPRLAGFQVSTGASRPGIDRAPRALYPGLGRLARQRRSGMRGVTLPTGLLM